MSILRRKLLLFGLLSIWALNAQAETCYVLLEKSGNFNPRMVETLVVSLVSKYVETVEAAPDFGVGAKDCAYTASLSESMNGFLFSLTGRNFNSMGSSKTPGMDGLTQSILRALYTGNNADKNLKKQICTEYAHLMKDDCRPVEAVVMFYDEAGRMIPDGSTVREGDSFFVMIQPFGKLHVNVINKDTQGNIFRIFPNPAVTEQGNPLLPNRQYFFPPQESKLIFRFDENTGVETFYFVISAVPILDIDILLDQLENASSEKVGQRITHRIENQLLKRGVSLGKKKHPVSFPVKKKKVSKSGDLLIGSGAFVKTVRLTHIR